MRRLLALLAALPLPPLGLWLWSGTGRLFWLVAAIWAIGLGVFFLLAAGPGFMLVVLATLVALAGILFQRRAPAPAQEKPA